jgi:hypothetical protein
MGQGVSDVNTAPHIFFIVTKAHQSSLPPTGKTALNRTSGKPTAPNRQAWHPVCGPIPAAAASERAGRSLHTPRNQHADGNHSGVKYRRAYGQKDEKLFHVSASRL